MRYERQHIFWKHFFLIVVCLLLSIAMLASCTKKMQGVAFDVLGKLSETALKELLQVQSLQKDSINISVIVSRKHCRNVLGKKLNSFVTSHGQTILTKKDVHLQLSWAVQSDTSKVLLHFIKYKK